MQSSSLRGRDASVELTPFPSSIYDSKASSLFETSSSTAINPTSDVDFKPTSSLQIQAAGKPAFSLPAPAKQLEIPIFSPVTGRPVYLSIRPRRRKGDCRLVRVDAAAPGEGGGGGEGDPSVGWPAIARTTYRFGPGRNPVVRIGREDDGDNDDNAVLGSGVAAGVEEFEMVSRGLLTRAVGFDTARWGSFEWRYGSRRERARWAADNLLVLEKVDGAGGRVRLAQLVRNDGLRTPGTKYMAAGNGGRLQMDLVDEGGREIIDEALVVVTCLVMLKKETDRLRAMQIAAMSAAAGGS